MRRCPDFSGSSGKAKPCSPFPDDPMQKGEYRRLMRRKLGGAYAPPSFTF